jgi:predicted GTPase
VLNKTDLENEVNDKIVEEFSKNNGFLSWIKISVKNNVNVSQVFEEVTESIMNHPKDIYTPKEFEDAFTMMDTKKETSNSSYCCGN